MLTLIDHDAVLSDSAGLHLKPAARPPSVPAGAWRRMSDLSRHVVCTVATVVSRNAVPADIPIVYGTAWGETVPSGAVLQRLFLEGPRTVSPTAFQGSVYSATIGHATVALGLTGPCETVCAGMATGLTALRRAADWVQTHPQVLVVVADGLNDASEAAMASVGPASEGVIVWLVSAGDELLLGDGLPGTVTATRALALPNEPAFQRLSAPHHPEDVRGLNTTNGLVTLLTHGAVTEQDDSVFQWARLNNARSSC